MNNFLNSLKRFFKNKNTVTILGVIVVLALLYWGYSTQIKESVKPITVPIASQTIPARTQITASMVTSVEISSIAITDNVYTSINAIVGKYTNVNTIVPSGSMFYKEAVISDADFRDSIFNEMEDEEIPYLFSVNIDTTYGNSIYPKTNVDIYMKTTDSSGKIIVGKLLEDVLVLAVRDSAGKDVFADTQNVGVPSYFVLGLNNEIHLLMRKAEYIGDIELFPIPHGGSYVSTGETKVSTEYLKDFINSKSVVLEGQEGGTTSEPEEEPTENNDDVTE